jgi:hypothetical protein
LNLEKNEREEKKEEMETRWLKAEENKSMIETYGEISKLLFET